MSPEEMINLIKSHKLNIEAPDTPVGHWIVYTTYGGSWGHKKLEQALTLAQKALEKA